MKQPSSHNQPVRRFRSYLLSIVFVVAISVPAMNMFFDFVPDANINENRLKAPFPAFDVSKLDPFPRAFEVYFEDHFVSRNFFLKQYMKLNLLLFQKSVIPDKAVVGTDGWLYMSGFELESYRGDSIFTDAELAEFTAEISRRDSIVRAAGGHYYFIIVPCKHSVYPEYLPDFAEKKVPKNNAELVMDNLHRCTGVKCMFPLKEIQSHKNGQYPLYSKTDNHWNHLGAFYAAQAVTELIRKDYPAVKPLRLSDYRIAVKKQRGGNIAEMFGMQDELSEDFVSLEPINPVRSHAAAKQNYPVPEGFAYPDEYELVYETGNDTLPKMLVVRESFATFATPFLSESASKAVFIFDAWQHKFNPDIFSSEKPDIYIQFVMEGFLRQMLRYSRAEKEMSQE
ncbi:SGNH hydrolase-like domain, acetyltransferase AlgX [anaerobic digester metagenome]